MVVEDLLLGWDQVQGLVPFCGASPAPVSLPGGLPLQNQIWVALLNSEDSFLGFSNTVGMKVRNGVT